VRRPGTMVKLQCAMGKRCMQCETPVISAPARDLSVLSVLGPQRHFGASFPPKPATSKSVVDPGGRDFLPMFYPYCE